MGAEGDTALAWACGVIVWSTLVWACGAFHLFVEVEQFAAGESAEFLFKGICQFTGEGEDDFFLLRVAGEISLAETGPHAEAGKRTAGAAHAPQTGPESRGKEQGIPFAHAYLVCKGSKNGLGAVESLVEIIQSLG